ncbi:MAG: hypothetical protein AB7H97_21895, partial [Pseudobdellovibrionaceae bacterium]
MDDISKLAHRLLLISKGQMVYDGTVNEFIGKAETLQKVTLKFAEPLKESLQLVDGKGEAVKLDAGADYMTLDVKTSEVAPLISRVVGRTPIQDIRIDETDFEDVIHRFLEKDSSR